MPQRASLADVQSVESTPRPEEIGPSSSQQPIGRASLSDVASVEPAPDGRSLFARGVDALSAPLLPQIATGARAVENYITTPRLSDSRGLAMLKGAVGGAVAGAGDVVGSFTSPLGLAATLSGVGAERAGAAELINTARALRGLEAASGAAFSARGLEQVASAPTLPEKAMGLTQAAAGALGVHAGVRGFTRPPLLDRGARPVVETPLTPESAPPIEAPSAPIARAHVSDVVAVEPPRPPENATPAQAPTSAPDSGSASTPSSPLFEPQPPGPKAKREPRGVRAEEVTWRDLDPSDRREVRRILAEMDSLPYQDSKLVRDSLETSDSHYVPRAAGAPVYWDIVGGDPDRGAVPIFRYSRGDVLQKIRQFVETGKRSVVSDLAVEVARGRRAGDASLRPASLPPEAGDTGAIDVARLPNLTPERAAVQDRATAALESDPRGFVAAYRQRFGDVVSADQAKEIFPDYQTPTQRTANDIAVHRPASALAQAVYDEILQEPTPEGKADVAVLTAGGTGAGKTTGLSEVFPELADSAHVVFDSTLSNPEAAIRNIEAARNTNHQVAIVFTDRHIVDAFRGSLERASDTGRPVTLNTQIRSHVGANNTFAQLRTKYANDPDVHFFVIRNDGATRQLVPLEAWQPRVYNESDVRGQLAQALEDPNGAWRANDALREAVYPAASRAGGNRETSPPGPRPVQLPQGEVTPAPVSREPGESGGIDPALAARLGLGGGGAAYGAATGTDTTDRLKRAAVFGAAGFLAPSLLRGGGAAMAAGVTAAPRPAAEPPVVVKDRLFRTNVKGEVPETTGPLPMPLRQLETFPPEQRTQLLKLLRDNAGFQEARGGGRQSWASIDAQALRTTVSVARPGKRGAPLPQELGAFKNALATLQDKAEALGEKVKNGTATDLERADFLKTNADRVAAASGLFGRVTEAGRALNYSKQLAQVIESADIKFVRQALKQGGDAVAVAEALSKFHGDPIAQLKYLQSQQALSPLGLARGVFFQNILSGVKTTLRNVAGNTLNAALDFTIRPLVTVPLDVVESAVTGRPREVFLGEIPPRVQGLIVGIPKAARDALFELQHGFSREATMAGSFDRLPPELPGGLPTNFATRFLQSQDRFQYEMLRESEEWGRAFASAKKAGRQQGWSFYNKAADLKLNLSDADKEAAALEAERLLFREDPGALVDWIGQGKRKFPMLDFIIPFIKISSNQIRQALERSPAGAVMAAAREGGRAGVEARGRALGGTAALAGLAAYVGLGQISGDGPTDPGQRNVLYQRGWKPNSIKLQIPDALAQSVGAEKSLDGSYWVSYLGTPMAPVLAAMANGYQTWNEQGRKLKNAEQIASATVFKTINSVISQSFWASALGLMEAMQDPERNAANFVRQYATSAVPFSGLQRNIAQAIDPTVRKPGSALESVKAIIPGVSQSVPPRLDVYGQPVQRDGNWFQRGMAVAPLALSPSKADPIDALLSDLGIGLQVPRPVINISDRRVPLSDEQTTTLVQAIGQERRNRLEQLVRDGNFQRLNLDTKAKFVRRALGQATEQIDARAKARLRLRLPFTVEDLITPMPAGVK